MASYRSPEMPVLQGASDQKKRALFRNWSLILCARMSLRRNFLDQKALQQLIDLQLANLQIICQETRAELREMFFNNLLNIAGLMDDNSI